MKTAPPVSPPMLVGAVDDDNLVQYAGQVWRVPQRLGSLDIAKEADRRKPGIVAYPDVNAALAVPRRRPTSGHRPAPASNKRAFACTWWEATGEYTEFVEGISSPVYRKVGSQQEVSSRELPPGALYVIKKERADAWPPVGSDGLAVACVLPGGHHWYIDSRASTCTMPEDHEHRCWVRHGTFGETIHVDKVGRTCQAGGGSIDVPGFHGHLHAGELREV